MAKENIEIPIIPVARMCSIAIPESKESRSEIEVHCPFCNAQKDHMYLHTKTNQFICFSCHRRGNSVSLYAQYWGMTNLAAYQAIAGKSDFPLARRVPEPRPEPYLAPLSIRHAVYYDMLSLLPLSRHHRINLQNRGLTNARIDGNSYRTMPDSWQARREIALELAKTYNLQGVPGFFTRFGEWQLAGPPGLLIPVCNFEGYIQGIQIRLDDLPEGKKKYRWLSSNPDYGYENGTKARVWVHVAGNVQKTTVCLTEGALKGDVASFFLNDQALLVCVPGTGSLDYLPATLRDLEIKKAVDCFDMDKCFNMQVAADLNQMRHLLWDELHLPLYPGRWNRRYKGLDDYYCSIFQRQNAA